MKHHSYTVYHKWLENKVNLLMKVVKATPSCCLVTGPLPATNNNNF